MGGIEIIPASVVIPVCNEADTIADTIRSIKQQAILPAELIVIDAGSNDDTLGIGRAISTISESIINKNIFDKIGYFREVLRSCGGNLSFEMVPI